MSKERHFPVPGVSLDVAKAAELLVRISSSHFTSKAVFVPLMFSLITPSILPCALRGVFRPFLLGSPLGEMLQVINVVCVCALVSTVDPLYLKVFAALLTGQ